MKVKWTSIAALLFAVTTLSCGEGGGDTCANCPRPVETEFEGVLAGNDGLESGTLSLTLEDDGTGSGSFTVGGNTVTLTSVSNTGGQLTASGGGFAFTGTVNGIFIDGSYTSSGAGGLLAAAEQSAQTQLVTFCAAHDAGGGIAGVFALVYNASTNAIRGAWTSGTGAGAAFKGIVSGFSGDDNAVMSGHPGTVTVLPNLQAGTVSGLYDLDSGESGTLSGPVCP